MALNEDFVDRYQQFVNYCNNVPSGSNDAAIAEALMCHLSDIESCTLDDIALDASISQPSVSRFLRKASFSSFADFRRVVVKSLTRIAGIRGRDASITRDASIEELARAMQRGGEDNLHATSETFVEGPLEELAELILSHRVTVVVGDYLELNMFYPLQLDLSLLGHTMLMRPVADDGVRLRVPNAEDTMVLFLSVDDFWHHDRLQRAARDAKLVGAKTAVLQQDAVLWEHMDLVMRYGIDGSGDKGYYSLLLVVECLRTLMARHL